MNIFYKLLTIIIVSLLHTCPATAMLAQLVRHKTLLAPLPALLVQQNSDSALCTAPVLSRTYSSSAACLSKKITIEEIQMLHERVTSRTDNKRTELYNGGHLIGLGATASGMAGYLTLPTITERLQELYPQLDSSIYTIHTLNALGEYICPGLFLAGGMTTLILNAVSRFERRLAHMHKEEITQALAELQKSSRVDMPEEKD